MKKLTIFRRFFTRADCYTKGTRQTSVGVQVHSTGANNPYLKRYVQPNDGRLGTNKYNNSHNRSGLDVCASAYIGKLEDGTVAVYQTLPWDYRCWLSGKGSNGNANKLGYIGYEICEDNLKDEAYFRAAVMEAAVLLTAHLCILFGTTPYSVVKSYSQGDALAVMDHRELNSRGLASNHGDIRHWASKYGVTMDDFRAAVDAAMREGVEVTYIDCNTGSSDVVDGESTESEVIPLYQAKVTCPGSYLNLRAGKSKSAESLYRLNRGRTVTVLDDTDPLWWRIQCDSMTGYAMTNDGGNVYLTRIEDGGTEETETPEVPETSNDNEATRETVEVDRAELETVYATIGKMLEV